MILWAFSFIWGVEALKVYSPFTITLFRILVSSVFLWVYALITNKLNKIDKKDLKYFLLLAFFEPFMYFLGETFGLQLIPSTIASVIISTIPIFVPIFAYYFYKDKLSILNTIGAVISLIGVLMIIINKELSLDVPLKGVLLLLLAVFSAVGYSLVVKHLSEKYRPTTIVTYQSTFAIIGFLPLFLIFDLQKAIEIGFDLRAVFLIIKLGIFASTFAFILYTYGVRKIGVSKAGFLTNAIPVFTAILAYFYLDEILSPIKYLGIFIVIIGLVISQIKIKSLQRK
jgi:drug/metabolite transporter (DMT)-like permease